MTFSNARTQLAAILRGASRELLVLHNRLIELRNQYIAHADDTPYDQSLSFLIINDKDEAVGVHIPRFTLENFITSDYQIWQQLVIQLQENLKQPIKQLQDSIVKDYNDTNPE